MAEAETFDAGDVERRAVTSGQRYTEFLRVPSLSAGLYRLPKGGTDTQSPHTEDEVYVVTRGRARIRLGTEDRSVGPGSVIYVPARLEHRFHTIEEALAVLVFFAPAEGSARRPGRVQA